jgi:chromosomal replication initiation ATPase DnaA
LDRERQIAEDRARTEIAVSVASAALGAARAEVMGGGRTYRVVLARQVAMYLLHVGCGLSLGRVSAAFGRDRTTISYAVKALELKRDEPAFDAWLQALEDSVVRAPVMS